MFHGLDIQQDENDTMAILRELEAGRDIHELLASIEGPYVHTFCASITTISRGIRAQRYTPYTPYCTTMAGPWLTS